MNKLLLNDRGRNHIKFLPLGDIVPDLPESEADQIKWCRAEFKKLKQSMDAKRLYLHKNRSAGVLISVWEMEGRYYLILCLRNEFKTFNNTIYISKEREDCLSIAKFLKENYETIMTDYKQQIIDAKNWLLEQASKPVEETPVNEA